MTNALVPLAGGRGGVAIVAPVAESYMSHFGDGVEGGNRLFPLSFLLGQRSKYLGRYFCGLKNVGMFPVSSCKNSSLCS